MHIEKEDIGNVWHSYTVSYSCWRVMVKHSCCLQKFFYVSSPQS